MDSKEFESQIRLCSGRLRNFLTRYTTNNTALEDILQNTYLRAWLYQGGLHDEGKFNTWLTSIAVNCVMEYFASVKKDRALVERYLLEDPMLAFDGSEQMAIKMDKTQLDANIRMIIAKLPDKFREVMEIDFNFELVDTEIGDILKIPLGTVKTRLRSARRLFKKYWLRRFGPNQT